MPAVKTRPPHGEAPCTSAVAAVNWRPIHEWIGYCIGTALVNECQGAAEKTPCVTPRTANLAGRGSGRALHRSDDDPNDHALAAMRASHRMPPQRLRAHPRTSRRSV